MPMIGKAKYKKENDKFDDMWFMNQGLDDELEDESKTLEDAYDLKKE